MQRIPALFLLFPLACGGRPSANSAASSLTIEGATNVDARDPITLRLQLRDGDGTPIGGAPVQWEVSGRANELAVGSGVTSPNGEALAFLRSRIAEFKTVRVTGHQLDLSETLEVLAGSPGSASTLAVSPLLTFSNGASPVHVELRVRDRFANPVAGVLVTVSLSGPDLRPTAPLPHATGADGSLTFDVVSRVAGDKDITLNTGDLVLTRRVRFLAP